MRSLKHPHHYRSPLKRGLLSFLLVFVVMTLGTVGIHVLENFSWVDAFYFMSMIATAQGPSFSPTTSAGKIFVSVMAFISVGSVVASLGFIFGPFLGKLWKVGIDKFEEEIRILENKENKKSK